MANHPYTYYYQFLEPGNQYSPGVYRTQYPNGLLFGCAHRTWVQGPRGGVQIINQWGAVPVFSSGYKTQDPVAMQEFAWVKLTAKSYGS